MLRLLDAHLVRGDFFYSLDRAARPRQFQQADATIGSEPLVNALVAGREIASSGVDHAVLLGAGLADEANCGSDAVPIADRAARVDDLPMIRRPAFAG